MIIFRLILSLLCLLLFSQYTNFFSFVSPDSRSPMNFTQYISKLTAGAHHQQSEDDIRMGEVKRVIRQNAITIEKLLKVVQSERQKAAAYADQQIPIIVRILKDKSLFEKLRERRGAIINTGLSFAMDHTSPIISLTTKASVDTKPTSVTPYMQLYGSSVSNQASPSIETKRKSITSSLESNVIFDASNQELSSFSTHSISNPTSSSVIDVTRLVPTTAIFTVEANSTCYSSFGYTTVSSLDELNCIALYTNTISNTSRGSSAIKDISHTKISGIVNDGKALTPLTAIDTFFNGDWYSICPDKSIFGCIKVLVNTALQDIKQLYKHSICITGYSLKESLMANSFLSSSSSSTLYQQFLGSFCQFGARDSRIVQKQHVAAAQFMVPGSNATHNILNDCTKSEPTAATISRNYTESSASTTTSNVERTSNTLLPASSNTHTSSTTSTSDNSTTNTSLKSRSQPPKTNRMLTASKEYRARKSARKIQIITLSSTPLPTATYTFSKNATSATMTWSRIPSLTLNQQYTTSNININKTTNTISISADDTATSTKSATRPRKRSRVPTASREYRARRFSRRERLNRFTSPNTENIIPSTKRRELHRIKAINPPSNWNSVKRYQQQKEPDYLTDDQKFMFEIQPIFLDGIIQQILDM